MNNIINASKNNNLINKEKNRNFKNNNNMNNSIHYKTNDIIIPNIVSNPATLYRLKKEFEPVKTPFKLSHNLLPKLRSQRKISWRELFCCPMSVLGGR